jgi:hypothetical protein
MGFNTVAVLYNDFNFAHGTPELGHRIQDAIRGWSIRDRDSMATHFGCGIVVSQAHADYTQIVAVGRNTGQPVAEATELDWYALDQMKRCLENHGFKVTKPKKLKPRPTEPGV